jgi:DNA repair protein RecO (recombination protein O)
MFHSLLKTEAIVIKEEDFGEDSKLFTLYTKNFGKIILLGKAIRKIRAKLRFGFQILNYISAEFVIGKNFNIATDAILKDSFWEIKKNFKPLRQGLYICNLLDSLISGQEKDERIWELLLETLFFLKRGEDKMIRYFDWNLFSLLGFEPELYYCARCQEKIKEGKIYFNAKDGGVICFKCYKEDKKDKEVSRDFVKILRLIINRDKDLFLKLKLNLSHKEEIRKNTQYYLENIFEERLPFCP